MRPTPLTDTEAFTVLGLSRDTTVDEVVAARRRLAKRAHPDAGGSVEQMQRLNAAADVALAALAGGPGATVPASTRRPPRRQRPDPAPPGTRRDHPSFTIEALPVEAFEALLVVASWLGDVIDDEPPYSLEVALQPHGWCRLDLVPDAGGSTVSLAVAPTPGYPLPDVGAVRDEWIAGLNQLDWDDPGGLRRP